MTILFILIAAHIFAMGGGEVIGKGETARTGSIPTADGVIGENEYAIDFDASKMKVALSINDGTIYFGLEGFTAGWIAIGFGSKGMHDSHILIGYVEDGTPHVSEQSGIGHSHKAADAGLLVSPVLAESDGITRCEGSLPLAGFIEEGDEYLDFIIACADSDGFTARHSFRRSFSVSLK